MEGTLVTLIVSIIVFIGIAVFKSGKSLFD